MALTRTQIEKLLVKRASKRMAFVGMDGITDDGTNADLNEPISTALQRMGIAPADITEIKDADLTRVENPLELIDLAELRLLENILGNMDMVDITVGDRSERLSQFTADLGKAIERKQMQVEKEYGYGLGALTAGVISLNFQQKHNDAFDEGN
ncbi:MAG: hypothetical protein PHQ36_05825 [Anaerolineales bacterium]|nr:hypothetical protein [Anaerolineales bacterium]